MTFNAFAFLCLTALFTAVSNLRRVARRSVPLGHVKDTIAANYP